MKRLFKIAIAGRPNVGKSSLFNRLCRKRRSIVDERPGVTRDRIEIEMFFDERKAVLVDTGGFFEGTENAIEEKMCYQIREAVREADFTLFIVDACSGMHPMDKTVFQILKKNRRPFLLVANKVDNDKIEQNVVEFYSFGIDRIFPISALHGRGMSDLKQFLYDIIPPDFSQEESIRDFRICVTGKPNVGKSSLINAILKEERVIVTDIPGTTRDEIDIRYSYGDHHFVFVDTSGLRKKKLIATPADQFGISRAQESIRKAVCNILVIDGSTSVTQQDKKIAHLIYKSGRACIVVVNKNDLLDSESRKDIREAVQDELEFLKFAPIVFLSAKKRKNTSQLLEEVVHIKNVLSREIETTRLNNELQKLQEKHLAPLKSGRRLKIYYGVQTNQVPLKILLFVNGMKLIKENYISYIKNGIVKKFRLTGIPVVLQFRAKKK